MLFSIYAVQMLGGSKYLGQRIHAHPQLTPLQPILQSKKASLDRMVYLRIFVTLHNKNFALKNITHILKFFIFFIDQIRY